MPVEPEYLEDKIRSAKRGVNADNSPIDYSRPEQVIAYCSEDLAQMRFIITTNLHLALEAKSAETRSDASVRLSKVMGHINFLNGIMGRVAQLQGADPPSLYHSFNTPEGNQIDRFLREIGYLKE